MVTVALAALASVATGVGCSASSSSGTFEPGGGSDKGGSKGPNGAGGDGETDDPLGGGGFGGEDDPAQGPAGCRRDTKKSDAKPANLMFQLDLSGSMHCLPTESTAQSQCHQNRGRPGSRWNIFRAALKDAVGKMPKTNGVGIMHYPDALGLGPNACVNDNPDVSLAPLSASLQNVRSALDRLEPIGGTPTRLAVTKALAQLQRSNLFGNKFLVLATDGEISFCNGCSDCQGQAGPIATETDQMIAEVAAANQRGIRTFVIGVPGSENFRAALSKVAEAGGTARPNCTSGDHRTNAGVGDCHYDMTVAQNFGDELNKALDAISGSVLSCNYPIPDSSDASFDPAKVNVTVTVSGTTTELARDTSKASGWDYSPDGKEIVLQGDACTRAKTAGAQVDIVYGCPTVVK
jgi:hypothetical protein